MSVSFKLGNRRLLALADLLSTVKPAKVLKSGQIRGYDQEDVLHPCGSPSCAWGWWLMASPSRKRRIFKEQAHNICRFESDVTKKSIRYVGHMNGAMDEFGLEYEEAYLIFAGDGCNHAHHNPKRAATFIREFVATREPR